LSGPGASLLHATRRRAAHANRQERESAKVLRALKRWAVI